LEVSTRVHLGALCRPLQVCHPRRNLNLSDDAWAELQKKWAQQTESPFVLYKLVKLTPETGAVSDLTEPDFAELEGKQPLAREWTSSGPDRQWVKAALEVMRKVKSSEQSVKLFLGVPVPGAKWPPALVESYQKVIFHPTDLGTIEQQLKDGSFAAPEEWESAVRRVFRNAFVFNNPDDPTSKAVRTMGFDRERAHSSCLTSPIVRPLAQVLLSAEIASRTFEKEMMRLKGVTLL